MNFTGIEERIENGGTMCPVMGASKEVVFPAECYRSHLALDSIIIEVELATSHNALYLDALREHVINSL
jgi:hypothetical protein